MPPDPGGPALVLGLVLAEVAVGGTAILFAAPLWGQVRAGFFKLVGAVLATSAVLAWVVARTPLSDASAGVPVALLGAFAGASVAWQVLLWARAAGASRVLGIVAVPVGVAALVSIALEPALGDRVGTSLYSLLAGAIFAGAATDGLLLGHWYLVDRRLGGEPLARVNEVYLAGAVLAGIGAVVAGSGPGEARAELSPLLGAGALAAWLAVGLAAVCALTGVFIRALVKERSMQAATGLFYLGVIMALAAEFASKVRLF